MFEISRAFNLFLEESYCAKNENIILRIMTVDCPSFWQPKSHSQAGQTVGKVLLNVSNYRKHVYLEETMLSLPLNC